MEVEPRKYRFRVLNASVSRSYDLALSTGEPLTIIGTDGGLMPHPVQSPNLLIGMAERYEVVIDFAKYKPGTQVVLQNLQPKNNIDHDSTNVVMAFKVGTHVVDPRNNEVPMDLNPNMKVMGLTEADAVRSRNFRFERSDGHWTINGTTWEDVVNSDYDLVCANPGYEDIEIWELENPGGGWFHPVHIHLVDFKVLDRNGQPPREWEKGPKDVVYVGENEKVRVIMKFENQRGKYMMHCHNLVHEDHDMMTQFQVGDMDRTQDPHDPIEADKCKDFKDMGELFRPKPNNSGRGNAEERGNDTISVPADVPAEQAAAAAPAPASGAPAAPGAPKPGIKVLGSKRKSKVKVKPRRKVKAKAKKVTAKKPVSKTTGKKPAAKKLGARKSPSARALKVRRGRK
jgi:hypothetical protein